MNIFRQKEERQKALGTFDDRIETEPHTKIPVEDISSRSTPETDSRSLPQSDNLHTDLDKEFVSSQFPTGESLETTVKRTHEIQKTITDNHMNTEGEEIIQVPKRKMGILESFL